MKTENEISLVEVFDGTQWQATMVKSLLENADIESFLKDSQMGMLAPWNVDAGGAGPVKIFVSSLDVDRAKEVIAQYEAAEDTEE